MTIDERFQSIDLSPFFSLFVDEAAGDFELPAECANAVDLIWQKQMELSGGKLFNGKLLSFVALDNERMLGKFVDYKYYLAQLIEPRLYPFLQIEHIAVSGITVADEMVLVGRRSEHVTAHPSHFELVPSGGIDPTHASEGKIDAEGQLLAELQEEAGISRNSVMAISPLALIRDRQKGGFELCMEIRVSPSAMAHVPPSTPEYDLLSWIPKNRLLKRPLSSIEGQNEQHPWLPFSLYLIDKYL